MKRILLTFLFAGCSANQSSSGGENTKSVSTASCLKHWSSENSNKLTKLVEARRVGAYALAARTCSSTEEQMSKNF